MTSPNSLRIGFQMHLSSHVTGVLEDVDDDEELEELDVFAATEALETGWSGSGMMWFQR